VAALLLLAWPATAAPGEEEREIRAAKEKIHALLRKAEELRRAGSHEDAQELQRKAEELKQRLHAHMKKRERPGGDELHSILEGLEHGMVALKRLGRHEEAEHLNRIANEVRATIAGRKMKKRDVDSEAEVVKQRLKTMRYAVEALLAAGKRDAADTLEHAMHALELALKGRHSTEAMHIRKTAPDVGQQAELLLHAAEILSGRGAKDKADIVGHLGKELAQQWRRKHAQREGKKRIEQIADGKLDPRGESVRGKLVITSKGPLRFSRKGNEHRLLAREKVRVTLAQDSLLECDELFILLGDRELVSLSATGSVRVVDGVQKAEVSGDRFTVEAKRAVVEGKPGEEFERLARRIERMEDQIQALAAALERFEEQLEEPRRHGR
jgi:hypothetical protein